MLKSPVIRNTGLEDTAALGQLYPTAFPDEELLPLVLRILTDDVPHHSFACVVDGNLLAHCLFTTCGIRQTDGKCALLGPLCVAPTHQRRGIGSKLVTSAIDRLSASGYRQVFVLGDPAYYQRFGFQTERNVRPPCPIPDDWQEAWRSLILGDHAPLPADVLDLPAPWLDPALWQP